MTLVLQLKSSATMSRLYLTFESLSFLIEKIGENWMLKGLNGAIQEKHLAWHLAINKYLIKMLMMIINGINL